MLRKIFQPRDSQIWGVTVRNADVEKEIFGHLGIEAILGDSFRVVDYLFKCFVEMIVE